MQTTNGVRQRQQAFPRLPYSTDALEPHLSRETQLYHFGKHQRGYFRQFTELVEGTEFQGRGLREIVRTAPAGRLFNAAAQLWNHEFFWHCLSPEGGGYPAGVLSGQLQDSFGSVERFKKMFTTAALDKFGSGWTWLAETRDGRLVIHNTDNAVNPMRLLATPLLVCDVWEHAYYIDYRNDRGKYLDAFWALVNWPFVAANLAAVERRIA
jgi:superoxide dismutase, Fe-Mn family